ncbi:MAG: patatin-like phospholipase family protein [Candidatus Omnitrophota bacterium]
MLLTSFYNNFNFLRQIPLFSKLNWLELHFIASKAELKEYKKGDIVYRKGEPGDAFYCLVSGRILAYLTDAQGHHHHVEYLYRGMYFGIVSLLTGDVHSLDFEALNDSFIIRIPKDHFDEILKKIPRLGIEISYSLSRRLRKQEGREKFILESNIIAVYSPFRGIGSSFYAFNLALHLKAETKKKVLFVDLFRACDVKLLKEATVDFSPTWKKDPLSFDSFMDDKELLLKSILVTQNGMDLLHVSFESKTRDLSTYISEFVSILAHDYHYIVLDLPNSADDLVFKTLTQSDDIHLVLGAQSDEVAEAKEMITRLEGAFPRSVRKERLKLLVRDFGEDMSLTLQELAKIFDYPVYAKLPQVIEGEAKTPFLSSQMEILLPNEESLFSQRMRRLAREIAKSQVGLVLGGGAAFGLSLIGVLRVLEKEKIPVDIIVGSSIGALIGGFWALGYRADEIAKFAQEFRSKLFCINLLDIVFPRSGLIRGNSIRKWLRRKIGQHNFSETKIPLKIIAYDLTRREDVVIDQGDVVDAICQSIGIPGFIRPVFRDGRVIIDGGIVNPLPTNVLTALGIQKIIAVNIMKSPEDIARDVAILHHEQEALSKVRFSRSPIVFLQHKLIRFFQHLWAPSIFDIIVKSFHSVGYVLAEQSGEQSDVLIHPDLTGIDWYELYKVDRLIEAGEKAAQDKKQELIELMIRK